MSGDMHLALRDSYPALNPQTEEDIREAIEDNFGGGAMKSRDLPNARLTLNGWEADDVPLGDLEGVLLEMRSPRQRWDGKYDPNKEASAPLCSSMDGFTGVGDPGGSCLTCVHAQWKKKSEVENESDRKPDCAECYDLFVLAKGKALPIVCRVSRGGITAIHRWKKSLTADGLSYWKVFVKLGYEIVKLNKTVSFAALQPATIGRIEPDDIKKVRTLREPIKKLIEMENAEHLARRNEEETPF